MRPRLYQRRRSMMAAGAAAFGTAPLSIGFVKTSAYAHVRMCRTNVSASFRREQDRSHLVFVYGTLKRSYPNARYLKHADFEGEYTTEERFPLVVGGEYYSPYLLNRRGMGYNVRGEVYRVDDETLHILDEFEQVGINYTRKEVTVYDEGERRTAYTYLKCNYTEEMLNGEFLEEYADQRYVERHLREQVDAARAQAAIIEEESRENYTGRTD